jgi:hypothetical protein
MQQVLLEKDQLKEKVRSKEDLIIELEQAKVNLNDQVMKHQAEI